MDITIKNGQLISLYDDAITTTQNRFLSCDKSLTSISLPNATTIQF